MAHYNENIKILHIISFITVIPKQWLWQNSAIKIEGILNAEKGEPSVSSKFEQETAAFLSGLLEESLKYDRSCQRLMTYSAKKCRLQKILSSTDRVSVDSCCVRWWCRCSLLLTNSWNCSALLPLKAAFFPDLNKLKLQYLSWKWNVSMKTNENIFWLELHSVQSSFTQEYEMKTFLRKNNWIQ